MSVIYVCDKKEHARNYKKNRYHTDEAFREREKARIRKYQREHYLEIKEKPGRKEYMKKYIREYMKRRYNEDPEFKRKQKERIKICTNKRKNDREKLSKQSCDILQKHHDDMKNDPEHLTTDFIKEILTLDKNKNTP